MTEFLTRAYRHQIAILLSLISVSLWDSKSYSADERLPVNVVLHKSSVHFSSLQNKLTSIEFPQTDVGLLQPKHKYYMMIDYRVGIRDDNAEFYAVVKSKSHAAPDLAMQTWRANPATGTINMIVPTGSVSDYYLTIGIKHKASLSVRDLLVFTPLLNAGQKPVDPSRAKSLSN